MQNKSLCVIYHLFVCSNAITCEAQLQWRVNRKIIIMCHFYVEKNLPLICVKQKMSIEKIFVVKTKQGILNTGFFITCTLLKNAKHFAQRRDI